MNAYSLPPLISAVVFLLSGGVVYAKSRSYLKNSFAFLCFLTVVWQFSWTFLFNVRTEAQASAIIAVGYSGIVLLPVAYYHFMSSFLGVGTRYIRVHYLIGGIFLLIHLSTDYLINGQYDYFWGYYPKAGVLHPLFIAYLIGSVIMGSYLLFAAWRQTLTPKRRIQIRYFSISYVLYCLAAVDFLINYGIEFYPFGVVFIMSSVAIMAYAIVKHDIMDVNLVVKRTVYYSALLALLIAPCLPVLYLAERYLNDVPRYLTYSMLLIVVGFVFPRIKVRAAHSLENLLFGESPDYGKIFNNLSKKIAHLLPLDVLLPDAINTVAEAVSASKMAIFLVEKSGGDLVQHAQFGGGEYFPRKIPRAALRLEPWETGGAGGRCAIKVEGIAQEVRAVPVIFESELIAVILFQEAGEMKNQREEGLVLAAIANQLAVAINNSRLYENIQQLNVNLEATVQERTEKLRKAFDDLKQLTNIKNDFFNRVSHELRTPLTNIILPIQTAIDDIGGEITGDNLREKQSMLRNASLLMKRINDILDIGKLEAGKTSVRAKSEDINTVISDVVSMSAAAARRVGVAVVYQPSPPCEVFIDADKVERILINIVNNAVKFTDAGGEVGVQLTEASDSVLVRIADTGCGIPVDQLPHIFDPFRQVDSGNKVRYAGTGLGLAIAREFMVLHHGEISVVSELGKGTVFTLKFRKGSDHFVADELVDGQTEGREERRKGERRQVSDNKLLHGELHMMEQVAEASRNHHYRQVSTHAMVGERLLIVEDNIDLSENIADMFAKKFSVATAENGQQGLEAVTHFSPDIIISDIMMPVMDGVDMCRQLKVEEKTRDIPVILLTAKTAVADRVEGIGSGADYYLEKPFNPLELYAVVRSLLAKKEMKQKLLEKNRELLVAHQDIQKTILEAERAGKAKSAFLASMSHELRTPLNAILGYADLLLEEITATGSKVYVEELRAIHASGSHLLALLNNILDISKVEAGKMQLHLEDVDFSELLQQMVDIVMPLAMKNKNSVNLHIEGDIGVVYTDITKLRQIIFNLLSNACKFTQEGEIQIAACLTRRGGKPAVKVVVSDTGIGIAPEKQNSLFSEFTQAGSEIASRYGGTGLGLALSRRMCELLGGEISLVSTLGEGAIFTFTIPTVAGESEQSVERNTA